jgi:hypothetical protein
MASNKDEKVSTSTAMTVANSGALVQVVPSTLVSSLIAAKLLPAEEYIPAMPDLGAPQIENLEFGFVPDNASLTKMAVVKNSLLLLSKNVDVQQWCKDNKVQTGKRRFDDMMHRTFEGMFFSTTKATRKYCLANALQFPPGVVIKSTFEKGKIGNYRPPSELKAELAAKKADGMPDAALAQLKLALHSELPNSSGYTQISPSAWCATAVAKFQLQGELIETVWDPHWFKTIANLVGCILMSVWRMYDETPPFDGSLPADKQPLFARVRRAGDGLMIECDNFKDAPSKALANFQLAALMLIYNQDCLELSRLFGVAVNVVNFMATMKQKDKMEMMDKINKEVMALKSVQEIILYIIKNLLLGPAGDGSGTLIKFVHSFFEPGSITCFDNPPNVTDESNSVGRTIARAQKGLNTMKEMDDALPDDERRKGRLAYWHLKVWPGDSQAETVPVNQTDVAKGNQVVPFAALESYKANIEADPLKATFSWRLLLDGVRPLRPSVVVVDATVGARLSLLGDEKSTVDVDAPIPGLKPSKEAFANQLKEAVYEMSKEDEAVLQKQLDAGTFKAQESSSKAFDKVVKGIEEGDPKYDWVKKKKERMAAEEKRKKLLPAPIPDEDMLQVPDPKSAVAAAAVSPGGNKNKRKAEEKEKEKEETQTKTREEAAAEEEKEKPKKKKQKVPPASPSGKEKKEKEKKKAAKLALAPLDEQD